MPQDFRIFRATIDTTRSLAAFSRKAFIDAYRDSNQPEYVEQYADQSFNHAVIRADIESSHCVFLVAAIEDEILGYAMLCSNQPIQCVSDAHPMQLQRAYVDNSKQGTGIGAALIEASVLEARKAGNQTIWLAAWNQNIRAHRFYERNGFRVVGKTYFMLGPERQEDVVMSRSIE